MDDKNISDINRDELLRLRAEINELDGEMLQLWQQRMVKSAAISRLKEAQGKPIYDGQREAELWRDWQGLLPAALSDLAAPLFCAMTGSSRLYQARERGDKSRLYLIGMPCSGKSSLGAALAKRLDRTFIDLDGVIEMTVGRSIPEIFAVEGESGFRQSETVALLAVALSGKPAVVACGGGVVLRPLNISLMRASGRVALIEREEGECLRHLQGSSRPLCQDAAAWQKLKRERQPLYEQAADYTVTNHDFISCVSALAALSGAESGR